MAKVVNQEECCACESCVDECPVNAIIINSDDRAQIDNDLCINCGQCQEVCPTNAISEE